MRILYHHRTRGEDAQGIHIRAMRDAFTRLGHQVRVIGPANLDSNSRNDANAGQRPVNTLLGLRVPYWVYELLALGYNFPAFLLLCTEMVRFRPHLVYERYGLYNFAGWLAAALFRRPLVLEVNAPLCLEMRTHSGLTFTGLAQALEDWLTRRATRTVVVSGSMRRILEERGVSPDRLVVTYNGVNRRVFNDRVDGNAVRREYGLEDRFVVGFVGWIRPWHGVHLLIDALVRVRGRIPNATLLLVGDGPAVDDLRQRADALGLGDDVVFVGPVALTRIPEFMAAMDVAVQPDVVDYASPLKLFEYLAMGRPVVAPRKPNIAEVVEDGKNALLFAPGEVHELADRIVQLHQDAKLRARLGQAAARLIDARGFYWEANARRVLEATARTIPRLALFNDNQSY